MKEDVDLKNLLNFDVSALKTKAEFEEKFKAIAEKLLKEYVLVLEGKEEYRLIEVELYLRDGKIHNDTFTHGDSLQLKCGQWYFHRFGKSFKAGTYKGLDLAFGKEEQKVYAGILIRAIGRPGEMIEGPCRSVDTILRTFSEKN